MRQTEQEQSVYRELILNYITTHTTNGYIPSERIISDALKLNRYLIRKHFDSFTRSGLIELVGHKRLLHSLPEKRKAKIGLLSGDATTYSYLDSPWITSGVISQLATHNCSIRNFCFRTLDQIAPRIRELGLDAVIWVEPGDSQQFDSLHQCIQEQKLPMVAVSAIIEEPLLLQLKYNIVTNNFYRNQREIAAYFAARSCRNIIYFSLDTDMLRLFRKNLREFGITLHNDCILNNKNSMTRNLSALMKKYPIDGIFCNGALGCADLLFSFLHNHPDFKPVLRVENHQRIRPLQEQYPDLKIEYQHEPYENWEVRLGKRAADMVVRLAQTQKFQQSEMEPQIMTDPMTAEFLTRNQFTRPQTEAP